MSNEVEHIRVIYRLLFDLATGRRLLEQDPPTLPAPFGEVRQRVYELAETLRALVLASDMVPPYAGVEHITAYVFVLDADYRLVDLNITASERLGYTPEYLYHRKFEEVLSSDSVLEWQRFVSAGHEKRPLFTGVRLLFLTENGTKLPLLCIVCDAIYSDWVFVMSIEVRLDSPTPLPEVDTPFKKHVATFEALHAYMLAHLDDALPSLHTLSSMLGIENHILQKGFKMYYGKSIYQFYQEERLKLGYQLILTTRLQLKDIAYRCGFGAYINFYKAFKKAYGHAPSDLLRP